MLDRRGIELWQLGVEGFEVGEVAVVLSCVLCILGIGEPVLHEVDVGRRPQHHQVALSLQRHSQLMLHFFFAGGESKLHHFLLHKGLLEDFSAGGSVLRWHLQQTLYELGQLT